MVETTTIKVLEGDDLQEKIDTAPEWAVLQLGVGSWGRMRIRRKISIIGDGSSRIAGITIRGSGNGSGDEGQVLLKNLIITGGEAKRGGGLEIDWPGSVVVEDCSIIGNRAVHGGGIWAVDGDVAVEDCVFKNNRADQGSSIFLYGGAVKLEKCQFLGNEEELAGGEIGGYDFDLRMRWCNMG